MAETIKSVTILTLVVYVVLKYFILNANENFDFSVGASYLKFHSNWTESIKDVPQLNDFHQALRLDGIKYVDISFSMSKFGLNDFSKLLPSPFSTHKKIKINIGNNEIGSKGVDYLLSLIPNGV